MPYYEVIYETGAHSVADYADDAEALTATQAHNDRATRGERRLSDDPNSSPAERVVRVLKYDKHPGDYGANQSMSADVAKNALADVLTASTVDGVVDLNAVQNAIREMSSPLAVKENPHDSQFKMQETEELELPWVVAS